jgi:pumilio family protein 6
MAKFTPKPSSSKGNHSKPKPSGRSNNNNNHKSNSYAGKQHGASNHSPDSKGKGKEVVKSNQKKWTKTGPSKYGKSSSGAGGKGIVKAIIDKHQKKTGGNSTSKSGSSKQNNGGKKSDPKLSAKSKTTAKIELVGNLKNDWNKVRIRTIDVAERNKLIEKLLNSIRGRVLQVTLRHDVSRIVQCVLQFGTDAQRSVVVNEMAPKVFEICKTPYGHFVVLKAITYCTAENDQKKIVSALKEHFVALGTNVIGARTVESILKLFHSKLTKQLKAEFYGKVRFLLWDCVMVDG